jgi:hypothetical protein
MTTSFQPIALPAARVVSRLESKFRPRKDRDDIRARQAAAHARADGGGAMDAALASVGAIGINNPAFLANLFKLRVEAFIERGASDHAVRARFSGRLRMLQGDTIEDAIASIESWYRYEDFRFQIASKFGHGTRLSLDVLRELRLLLRLARVKLSDQEFRAIVAGVLGAAVSVAAE